MLGRRSCWCEILCKIKQQKQKYFKYNTRISVTCSYKNCNITLILSYYAVILSVSVSGDIEDQAEGDRTSRFILSFLTFFFFLNSKISFRICDSCLLLFEQVR